MFTVTDKDLLDGVQYFQTISGALSLCTNVRDVLGAVPIITDENGDVIEYRFNARGVAYLATSEMPAIF